MSKKTTKKQGAASRDKFTDETLRRTVNGLPAEAGTPTPNNEQVVQLRVSEIEADPNQPRRNFDQEGLRKLGASIVEVGVQSPIVVVAREVYELRSPDLVKESWGIVRVEPDGTRAEVSEWPSSMPNGEAMAREEVAAKNGRARYTIVFGERRWRASCLVGKETIPAIVRAQQGKVSKDVQLIENLNREGLTAAEEGAAYREAIDEGRHTVESLMALTGLKRTAVYARLQLVKAAPMVQDAVNDGRLPDSIANFIVRIPGHKLQERACKEIIEGGGYEAGTSTRKCMSAREAAAHIAARYTLELDKAGFDVTDGALVTTAGACAECPKRSGCSPELFADITNPNVCTDPDCFAHKSDVAREQQLDKARNAGLTVLTAKETKGLFQGAYLSYGNGFATPDQPVSGDTKMRTVAQILAKVKDAPKPLVAVDGTGAVREVYSVEAIRPYLEKVLPKVKEAREELPLDEEESEEAKAKRELEQRIDAEVKTRLVAAMVAKVEAAESEKALASCYRLLIDMWDRYGQVEWSALYQRRNWPAGDSVQDCMKRMKSGEVLGVMLEAQCCEPGGYTSDDLNGCAEELGVNVEKISKAVRAEVAAKAAQTAKAEAGEVTAKNAKSTKKGRK